MKKSLAHLPELKAEELQLIAFKIRSLCDDVHMVVLFGSYARGDFKDGPHSQGRGRLIIHKRSDYDILVLTANEYTARDITLWDKVKEKLAKCNLSTDYCPELAGILPREIDESKELFELLDYAYIGARYDREYKITKQQLKQLAPCVKKLHEVTERICKEKIESFA